MRLDDPRLAALAAATGRPVGGRLVRRGVGRPPPVHRGRPARGRRDPPRPPQGLPADLRAVRRAALLRGRATCCGPCRRGSGSGSGSASARTSGTSACPQLLALDGAQILINVSSSPGRDLAATNEVGLGTATSWRTLMRDLRPADDLVRGLLQPRRRGRVDLVLGRLRGDRPDRRRRSSARRSTTRACSSSTIAAGDIRRERIALPLLRDERPELHVARADADRRRAGRPDVRPDRRPGRRGGAGRGARAAAARSHRVRLQGRARAAADRHGPVSSSGPGGPRRRRCPRSSCPRSWPSTPTSRAGSSASSSAASCARPASSARCSGCRAASTRRSSRTSSPRRSAPSGCCAC